MKNRKVALVCDWLTEKGGAEDVLYELHSLFPDAPIYTSQYRKRRIDWFKNTEVRTGWLNYFPVFSRRFIAPLRQKYFKSLDLSDFDLVISVTGCDAKFIKTSGTHLCFCHVPTQYYWGKYDEYVKNPGFGVLNPLVRLLFKRIAPKLRQNDLAAAKRPDKYITISNYAKNEIKKYYKREAKVVNPPVKIELFTGVNTYEGMKRGKSQMAKQHNKTIKSQESQVGKNEQKFYTKLESVENLNVLAYLIAKYKDGFYVNFSRQVNWKRLDLVVKCCKKLKLPLVMIGNGPENRRLRKLARAAHDYITFVDFLPKSDLAVISSLAKAFIFPSEEPFGIAPIEALAAGCPVIALKAGGALDYIKDGKNGVFFKDQTEESLEKALKKFDRGDISLDSPSKIQASVKKYSKDAFLEKMRQEIDSLPKKKSKTAKISSATFSKIKTRMILFLPLILFFSNFPIINLGDTSSMHLKLSLPLLFIAVFAALSLGRVIKYFKESRKTPLLAFPLAIILSLAHSSNPLRGFLTFITLSCLVISVIGIHLHLKEEKMPKNFRKTFIIESVVICAVCFIQALFDRLGVPNSLTLLCNNCTRDVFGFAHPNGFAIEPQFMGTLLIVPIFMTLNSLLENKNKKCQIKYALAATLIMSTIFFTFSRGTIYAVLVALVFLSVGLKNLKKSLMVALIAIISFGISLGSQILLSTTPMENTIETVINQLSLGKISIKGENDHLNKEFEEPKVDLLAKNSNERETMPYFSGYVAESTNRRLELATFALNISTKTPSNLVFGTGLGSAGVEMYKNFPERQGHEKEIVQNQYLETLLEFGIFGVTMLILSLVTFIKLEKIKFNIYLQSAVVAFMITMFFFSGLPSALHIYLLPVLWYNSMYDKNRLS